ncbi:hypothetical protein HN446_01300 [bacterium]|jgi:hypothetical protein|nr:hypothetical protein [bacterium]
MKKTLLLTLFVGLAALVVFECQAPRTRGAKPTSAPRVTPPPRVATPPAGPVGPTAAEKAAFEAVGVEVDALVAKCATLRGQIDAAKRP